MGWETAGIAPLKTVDSNCSCRSETEKCCSSRRDVCFSSSPPSFAPHCLLCARAGWARVLPGLCTCCTQAGWIQFRFQMSAHLSCPQSRQSQVPWREGPISSAQDVDEGHMQCPFWVYFQEQAPAGFPLGPPRASLKCGQIAWTGGRYGPESAQLSTVNVARQVGKAEGCLPPIPTAFTTSLVHPGALSQPSIRPGPWQLRASLSYLLVALIQQSAAICKQWPGKPLSQFWTMFSLVSGCLAPWMMLNCFFWLVWKTGGCCAR